MYNERNTKYTFKVSNPTNAGSVINLVVVDMDGDIIEYFIQYIFDPNSPTPRLSSGAIDMARFTGGMTFYNMEGSVIGNFILNDGDLIDFDGEIDPCPEDEVVEEENDATDDTNNSNSGGGGTQSSDTDNSNDGTTGGNEDPDNPNPCVIGVSYGDCGCGPLGANDGHSRNPDSHCCKGSPTTFTDTCNGNSFTINNRSISGESSPCDGPVAIIIEDEIITNQRNCNQLKKLSLDYGTKSALYDLTQNTNQTIEKGFAIKNNATLDGYDTPQATVTNPLNPNEINMKPYLNGDFVGIFHTHTKASNGVYPMFAPGDIFSLSYLAAKHNTNGQPKKYEDYVVTLTVPQSTYAIKIKDWFKFNTAMSNNYHGINGIKAKLEKKFDDRGSAVGDINDLIKDLIDIFKEFDMGTGLYEASDDLNDWSELIHDLNPMSPNFGFAKEKPCN